MPTPRKPTAPTTEAIDQFCAAFDDLLARYEERTALRQYLIGLLLPREHNKTLVELGAIVPGADRQRLHHFLHDAPWDAEALNRRRLAQWQAHPYLGPHAQGVLIVDETGDPKRGQRIVRAAQHYLGKRGHVANGVVAVTSHWTDGSRHLPLGVKPSRPARRLATGRKDPAFHTQPEWAWQLIEEACAAGIPFRLVVADAVYGERATREARLSAARIPDVLGGPASLPWDLAGRGGRGPSAGVSPRRGGAATAAGGLAAHGPRRQPRQDAGPLRGGARAGTQLGADPRRAPHRGHAGPGSPHAGVHLVSGHRLVAAGGQC
jgi:hypothetical protein